MAGLATVQKGRSFPRGLVRAGSVGSFFQPTSELLACPPEHAEPSDEMARQRRRAMSGLCCAQWEASQRPSRDRQSSLQRAVMESTDTKVLGAQNIV